MCRHSEHHSFTKSGIEQGVGARSSPLKCEETRASPLVHKHIVAVRLKSGISELLPDGYKLCSSVVYESAKVLG